MNKNNEKNCKGRKKRKLVNKEQEERTKKIREQIDHIMKLLAEEYKRS